MSKDITIELYHEISDLIETAKFKLAHYANSALVLLYWQIGILSLRFILRK